MTTLTLSPASLVRQPLSQAPALGLPKELSGRIASDRAAVARGFLLALLRSLVVPAA